MAITELKGEYVLATLGKGTRVVMCDYTTNRMVDCGAMRVEAIQSFIEKDTVKFFTVVENE